MRTDERETPSAAVTAGSVVSEREGMAVLVELVVVAETAP
jgi:hypothetical protein